MSSPDASREHVKGVVVATAVLLTTVALAVVLCFALIALMSP